jgi:hypothetical protein
MELMNAVSPHARPHEALGLQASPFLDARLLNVYSPRPVIKGAFVERPASRLADHILGQHISRAASPSSPTATSMTRSDRRRTLRCLGTSEVWRARSRA